MSIITYAVIFPPFAGGNHLSNLILTTTKYPELIDTFKDYYSNIDGTANAFFGTLSMGSAHHPELIETGLKIRNCEVEDTDILINYIKKFDTHCSIAGHIDELYYQYHEIVKLGPVAFINIEIDSIELLYKRINVKADSDKHFRDTWLYRYDKISKLFQVPETSIIDIPVSEIFSPNILPVLDRISNSFGLEQHLNYKVLFDEKLCQDLHTKWFNMINK